MYVEEGGVEIVVPEQADAGADASVFYNPEQELNRDLTIAVLRVYREHEPRATEYLDAMAASGIRGVRAAADGWEVACADIDEAAVTLCRENLERNALDGEVHQRDANALLHDSYFDVVDIDPFGTPIPFVDAAFQGTRNLLCVTATDTAPLCGAHFPAGVRRYSTVPRNTEYHAEMGVRVLLSALVRTGARYDIAPRPLLTHATRHYVRTYLELDRGATVADEAVADLGHIYHCEHCLWRATERGLHADAPASCPCCDHGIQTAGPVWLGPTHDASFVNSVADAVPGAFGSADRATDMLARLEDELHIPTHYDQHRLCKRWGRSANAMDEFLGRLSEGGFRVSRTHYGGTTFKTDADVTDIREATRPQ